jgi:hypothetical protein
LLQQNKEALSRETEALGQREKALDNERKALDERDKALAGEKREAQRAIKAAEFGAAAARILLYRVNWRLTPRRRPRTNAELGLLLARKAVDKKTTEEAEAALRKTLLTSRLRITLNEKRRRNYRRRLEFGQ